MIGDRDPCSVLSSVFYVQLVPALGEPSSSECKFTITCKLLVDCVANLTLRLSLTAKYVCFLCKINLMSRLSLIRMLQIKWICPTSPAQPFTLFGGLSTTACRL